MSPMAFRTAKTVDSSVSDLAGPLHGAKDALAQAMPRLLHAVHRPTYLVGISRTEETWADCTIFASVLVLMVSAITRWYVALMIP